jgi:cytochrome c-type biogenesis protein
VTLELASLLLAWIAGVVSVLSPCVWPLVPVVVSSAATGGHAAARGALAAELGGSRGAG